MKHSVKRLDEYTFLYRGKRFEIDMNKPTGYAGRYILRGRWFTYQWQVKEYIDKLCVEANVETFLSKGELKELIAMYKD